MSHPLRPVLRRLPNGPGVYRFRDARGTVLYLGRATDLRNRAGSYFAELRDRRHLRPMVARIARIEAVACDSVHEASWLERNLLERSKPRYNITAGGQEVPVYLRLDSAAGTPGLRIARTPDPGGPAVTYFGPYLGGLRTRQAASALHRLQPLGYAGSRLTGAERAMAEHRGIAVTDREALAGTLTAILSRDPDAVAEAVATLTRLRDRAAGTLAYELAGHLQTEIEALEWITCPQRVTTMDAGDVEAHGWSDGLLVSFTGPGGRVRQWSKRPCGRTAGSALVAGTPPGWRGFAQRNAELAAALSA